MEELDRLFAQAGAAAWGAVSWDRLAGEIPPQRRELVEARYPHAATILIAAFPYYAGAADGNLSLYARGTDYHLVLGEKLKTICDILSEKYPSYSFLPSVDASPLPEREAAWLAGVGLRGKNGLVIVPPYGSYVFLGGIVTDKPLDLPETAPAPDCLSCGKCVAVCPSGALTEGGVDPSRCLSALTQRKGELTEEEAELVRKHPLIWGCDLCQAVCPYNAAPAITPLAPFREDLIFSLTGADLEGLTHRAFQAKYPGRAFTWRGPGPLRRNLELKHE